MDINTIKKELRNLERELDTMGCPECGGVHECRLHCLQDGTITITFIKSSFDICHEYQKYVHKVVGELRTKYNLPNKHKSI